MIDPKRARARELAAEAIAAGEPEAWFERLYQEAQAGEAIVPWDDRRANPLLVAWLDRHAAPRLGARALDVGCGTGDNAAELASRGWTVTAFDVAPTAVAVASVRFPEPSNARRLRVRMRSEPSSSTGPIDRREPGSESFPGSGVTFEVASATDPPPAWRGAFDLVVEIYTLQVLPPAERARAAQALAALVAPGGTLLVIARAREIDDPPGAMPWPLIEAEIRAIGEGSGLVCVELGDVLDDETPPVRRWVAAFTRR